MILHFSHIGLTDGRTFIGTLSLDCSCAGRTTAALLVPVGDAASGEVVGSELDLHAVARQDSDVVHPHLPGDVREHLVPVLELDTEHGVRQRLDDRAFDQDRVVLGLSQDLHLLLVLRALPCPRFHVCGSLDGSARTHREPTDQATRFDPPTTIGRFGQRTGVEFTRISDPVHLAVVRSASMSDRRVALEGPVNWRDLGGYPAMDGTTTRWGRLFRSDSMHTLTAADIP